MEVGLDAAKNINRTILENGIREQIFRNLTSFMEIIYDFDKQISDMETTRHHFQLQLSSDNRNVKTIANEITLDILNFARVSKPKFTHFGNIIVHFDLGHKQAHVTLDLGKANSE